MSPTRAQLRIGRDLHAGLDRIRELYGAGELDQLDNGAGKCAFQNLVREIPL